MYVYRCMSTSTYIYIYMHVYVEKCLYVLISTNGGSMLYIHTYACLYI